MRPLISLTPRDPGNIALAGTLCTEGTVTGIVVGRGNDTIFGRIAKAAGGPRPVRSTMQVEITRFVCISESFVSTITFERTAVFEKTANS